jgi:hypothetical protein
MAAERPLSRAAAPVHMVALKRLINRMNRYAQCRLLGYVHMLVTALYSFSFLSNFELNRTIIHTYYFLAAGGGGRIPSLIV